MAFDENLARPHPHRSRSQEQADEAMLEPHVKGWILVEPNGVEEEDAVQEGVRRP